MQRDTLIEVLERAAGLEREGERFERKEGHELTVYLGQPGRAMVVNHVLSLTLLDRHVEIEARDRGTLYTDYEAVHALLDNHGDDKRPRGAVGFRTE